jgi:hypothetical protein
VPPQLIKGTRVRIEAIDMRDLRDIAIDIKRDWRVINNQGAKKALDHMRGMGAITDPFYYDPDG